MISLLSTGTELRRFRHGTLPKIAVGAMLLIPLLYGALYLWAFWDPTGNLDNLPVALVNADTPAQVGGTTLDAGSDVAARLLDSKDLDWVVADADEAADGVSDGTYYFALTIPADFSERIASAGGDDPTAAELEVTYNDANSFLATTLGRQAMSQVRTAVSDTVGEQAVESVLVGLGSAHDGFAQASDGAVTLRAASGQLAEGATQGADGAASLATGAATAAQASATVAAGAAELATGATDAATGATALATGAADAALGASTLAPGATAVADGATAAASSGETLAAGAAQVATGVDAAAAKVGSLAGQLPGLSAGLTPIGSYLATQARTGDVDAQQLLAGLQTLTASLPGEAELTAMQADLAALDTGAHAVATGATTLDTGLVTLADGANQVSGGVTQLATGTRTLSDGAGRLATGTGALADGANKLSDGAGQLATGTDTLSVGSADLADGVSRVADGAGLLGDGTQTLSDALTDGAARLPADSAALRAQRAKVISSPVSIGSTDTAEAEGFGEGFAPFFIPLALFVGALITWLLLRPVPPRALATPASGWRAALAGFLPALAIGVGQVVIMLAVIHYGVGLEYSSVAGTVTFTLLIVAAFLALQQTLNAVFGPAAGKVAILALLMLQLASSGGTYPVETTPLFFRVIHPLLPMSYAVSGLREVITGGIDARLWTSVAYLGALLVVSLTITAWRAGRMRTWSLSRLHPVLAI
ncbi:YhgE/Pip domain-containing protein [Pengzhenrongella frigida]|uniref:YhgE/Pip domain-containing protein n=1 Tax=Pengzhenrongella frigida TaxID=1259133 RepID=A0A4Q5N3E6_9MICO|nr:YhgE/Pip domain-containing protein [Cellulomonas sp. HLT2-17]RYV50531.1 YhgE/Pip domain-containing protein [Cellulomonas sp. HLT2-17]